MTHLQRTGEKGDPCLLKTFDGAYHTHSIGKAIDFNVMYKKGMHAAYSVIMQSKIMSTNFPFLRSLYRSQKDPREVP